MCRAKDGPKGTDRTNWMEGTEVKTAKAQNAETTQPSEAVERKFVALKPTSGCYRIVGRDKTG